MHRELYEQDNVKLKSAKSVLSGRMDHKRDPTEGKQHKSKRGSKPITVSGASAQQQRSSASSNKKKASTPMKNNKAVMKKKSPPVVRNKSQAQKKSPPVVRNKSQAQKKSPNNQPNRKKTSKPVRHIKPKAKEVVVQKEVASANEVVQHPPAPSKRGHNRFEWAPKGSIWVTPRDINSPQPIHNQVVKTGPDRAIRVDFELPVGFAGNVMNFKSRATERDDLSRDFVGLYRARQRV